MATGYKPPATGCEALGHVRSLEQFAHFIHFKTALLPSALEALRKRLAHG